MLNKLSRPVDENDPTKVHQALYGNKTLRYPKNI